MVGCRLHDLLAGLVDLDERPAKIRHRGQVGELAQYVAEGVQAVAHRDREQVGPVCVVEHVGVCLDHGVARNRQPNHGRRQDLTEIAVMEQFLDELDRRGLAGLQPDDCAHALLGRERCHRLRLVEVAP